MDIHISNEKMPQYDPMFGEAAPLVDRDGTLVPHLTGRNWPSVVACLCACLSSLSTGFAVNFSSPTEDELRQLGLLPTENDKAWYSSLITLGAIAGAPLAGWSVDFIGRKGTILFVSVPLVSGWMLIASANGAVMLFCGRILTGIALGSNTLCVPLYIAEIAPKKFRGMLGASFQLTAVIGVFAAFSLGIVVDYVWLSISATAVATVMVVAMFFMPETPRWLLRQKRTDDALRVMTWLRGPSLVVFEEVHN